MLYQSRLADFTGRDQRHIIAIFQFPKQLLALFLPVTEVLGRNIAFRYKWIHSFMQK